MQHAVKKYTHTWLCFAGLHGIFQAGATAGNERPKHSFVVMLDSWYFVMCAGGVRSDCKIDRQPDNTTIM